MAKAMQDVKGNEAASDVVAVALSSLLGGDTQQRNFFKQVQNLTFHSLAGTSTGIFFHFWQIYKAQRFQCFDYGEAGNVKHYGQAQPLDILDHYNLIDIPVHFLVGLEDKLISPVNILQHYYTLHEAKPQFAFLKAFPNVGHADFTYGSNDDITRYVLSLFDLNGRALQPDGGTLEEKGKKRAERVY
eukprot:TRINITY_DN2192_c0_g1_i24.p2 TRINITY_DN2192_c0_g1~~TRINITY_DN2192_c0_g1_i24.p2  ORF type:complete len:187 (-),score=43.75 TRINITY_DN2192_c0_g1_i24:616-1176(-)